MYVNQQENKPLIQSNTKSINQPELNSILQCIYKRKYFDKE